MSEITSNRAKATKDKMEALEKLMDVIQRFGELETMLKANDLQSIEYAQESKEDVEKLDAKRTALSNEFVSKLISGMGAA